mmetsp:Transcript_8764/g.28896  ORF Transcript_8764/g.28896 Transcript_8764/m.28896 type:complete len:226 (-) Transcript_8764:24-701(-)
MEAAGGLVGADQAAGGVSTFGLDLGDVQPDGLRHGVHASHGAQGGVLSRRDARAGRGDGRARHQHSRGTARARYQHPWPLHGGRQVGHREQLHRGVIPQGAPPSDADDSRHRRHRRSAQDGGSLPVPNFHDHDPWANLRLCRTAAHHRPRTQVDPGGRSHGDATRLGNSGGFALRLVYGVGRGRRVEVCVVINSCRTRVLARVCVCARARARREFFCFLLGCVFF